MKAISSALAAFAISCTAAAPRESADPADLNVTSASGITVTATRWVSARTLEVDISTPLIAPIAVNGPHRIRVTFPADYFATSDLYPVVYLLHGGAGGNSAQWTSGGGAVEDITDGRPVIVVMPDGGKVGWFTDWVAPTGGAQQWATFYHDQVIPWVDANFRTVAAQTGRAIGGLSMGGYGAVRLAQDRPDQFASVGSFSGAVDLGDLGTRTVVTEQALQYGFSPIGPFGSPFWPQDTVWNAEDPMHRASALAGLQVLLYAGAGISDVDVLERTMGQSADRFSRALDAAGIPHFWWMYGRPGPTSPYGCDGGHDFSCWNFAFNDALPRMMQVLDLPPVAPGSELAANGGFEHGLGSWSCIGPCGTDDLGAFSHTGGSNGWVRSDSDWNDLHQTVVVDPNRTYTISAWIRTSPNTTAGFFGARTTDGHVIGEQSFAALGGYTQLSVTVSSGSQHALDVYAGFWADGDTWLQLDDVSIVAN